MSAFLPSSNSRTGVIIDFGKCQNAECQANGACQVLEAIQHLGGPERLTFAAQISLSNEADNYNCQELQQVALETDTDSPSLHQDGYPDAQ